MRLNWTLGMCTLDEVSWSLLQFRTRGHRRRPWSSCTTPRLVMESSLRLDILGAFGLHWVLLSTDSYWFPWKLHNFLFLCQTSRSSSSLRAEKYAAVLMFWLQKTVPEDGGCQKPQECVVSCELFGDALGGRRHRQHRTHFLESWGAKKDCHISVHFLIILVLGVFVALFVVFFNAPVQCPPSLQWQGSAADNIFGWAENAEETGRQTRQWGADPSPQHQCQSECRF